MTDKVKRMMQRMGDTRILVRGRRVHRERARQYTVYLVSQLNDPADGHTHEDIRPGGAGPIAPVRKRKDPLRLAIRVTVFVVVFYGLGWFVLDPLLRWLAGNLAGPTVAVLISAVFATWLSLRIYEDIPVLAVGLWWNRSSAQNLRLGLLGGLGAAVVALAPPLLTGAAHIVGVHSPE